MLKAKWLVTRVLTCGSSPVGARSSPLNEEGKNKFSVGGRHLLSGLLVSLCWMMASYAAKAGSPC